MRVPTFLIVVLVGLMPIGVFASLFIVPANVKWQPPLIWETKFGTPGGDARNAITAVAADKTGVYAVGYVGQPTNAFSNLAPGYAFLKKFDLSGKEVWSQQLGNLSSIEIGTVNVGPDGLYLSGISLANFSTKVFVEKHDFNGNIVWTRYFTGISGLSVDASRMYVASVNGSITVRSYDLNGNLVWTTAVTNETGLGSVLVYAASGGVFVAGSGPPPSTPYIVDTHAFIARYDSSGVQVWSRQFDIPPSFTCACVPYGLSGDSSGIYVGGNSYDRSLPGESSFSYGGGSFLRKYDWNGNTIWTVGEAGSGIGKISANHSGIYSLEGFGQLARYDGNGNRVWSVTTQGGPADLAVGEAGVYTGGGSNSSGFGPDNALLVGYSQSASLVLGGINPPYSFLILGSLGAAVVFWVFWVRWRSKKRVTRVKVSTHRYYPSD